MRSLLFALALLAAPVLAEEPAAVDPLQLAKVKGCAACHDLNIKKVGPSLRTISAKYQGKPDAEDNLVKFVLAGTKHPKIFVSPTDLRILVHYSLSQIGPTALAPQSTGQ